MWGLGRREAPVTQGLWEERKEESEARQALRSRTLPDTWMDRIVTFAPILPACPHVKGLVLPHS